MNRSRYSQKPRGCERRGADGSCDFGVQPSTFPESRVRRGELGHAPVAELLRDLRHALRCRAFVGTLSAGVSKIVFALQLVAHAQVPPFVSLGGCTYQVSSPDYKEMYGKCTSAVTSEPPVGELVAWAPRAGAWLARSTVGTVTSPTKATRETARSGAAARSCSPPPIRHRLEPIGRRLSVALPALRAL